MSQTLRNKLYGTITGVLGVLVVLGVIDQATSDEATSLLTVGLDLGGQVIGLIASVTAFVKSLPSRTVTLDLPRHRVEGVLTTDGATLAGPASPAADGTVLD